MQREQWPHPIIVSPVTRRPSHAAVDARPDRGDHAAPLVPEAHRICGMSLVQIGHLAVPELDIGAADAGSENVDDRLALAGDGVGNLIDRALVGSRDDERSHQLSALIASTSGGGHACAPVHAGTGSPRHAQHGR